VNDQRFDLALLQRSESTVDFCIIASAKTAVEGLGSLSGLNVVFVLPSTSMIGGNYVANVFQLFSKCREQGLWPG
jgi:hypothetical protein